MTQRQLDLRPGWTVSDLRKEYGRQIMAVYNNEVELIRRGEDSSEITPEPVGNPLEALKDVADHLSVAIGWESTSVRSVNGDASIRALSEVTSWIPVYQQIAAERDRLAQQLAESEEAWKAKEAKWEQERAELIAQLDEMRANRDETLPPAEEPPAARTPCASTPSRSSPQREDPHSPGREAEPLPDLSQDDSSEPPTPMPTPLREPIVVLERMPAEGSSRKKRATPSKADASRSCSVCSEDSEHIFNFRCRPCKEFWRRLKVAHQRGRKLPVCQASHPGEPGRKCSGCRRRAYERAYRNAHPEGQLPIPSVEDTGFRSGGGCEPSGLTELFPLSSPHQ
uniref:Uncharacterized protein n=2 Tax=Lygus hesperus TaxID=30085 RepID=A0A0K8SNH0_LYGHE